MVVSGVDKKLLSIIICLHITPIVLHDFAAAATPANRKKKKWNYLIM